MAIDTRASGPKPSNERVREIIARPETASATDAARLAQEVIDRRTSYGFDKTTILEQQQEIARLREQLEKTGPLKARMQFGVDEVLT